MRNTNGESCPRFKSLKLENIKVDDEKEVVTLCGNTLSYDEYVCLAKHCPLYEELENLRLELIQHIDELKRYRHAEKILIVTKCIILCITICIHLIF